MTNIELAIEKVKSGPLSDGSGLICQYYNVGDVGAKVYNDYDKADKNRNSQIHLHTLGFAPKVLSDVIEFNGKFSPKYMFLTETVVTIKQTFITEGVHYNDKDDLDNYIYDFEYSYRHRHFKKLIDALYEAGFDDSDQHHGNYGYLPSGKPVVIDCEFVHEYIS